MISANVMMDERCLLLAHIGVKEENEWCLYDDDDEEKMPICLHLS